MREKLSLTYLICSYVSKYGRRLRIVVIGPIRIGLGQCGIMSASQGALIPACKQFFRTRILSKVASGRLVT